MFILDEFDVVQLDDSLAKEDNQTNSYNKFMTYKTIFDLIQFWTHLPITALYVSYCDDILTL